MAEHARRWLTSGGPLALGAVVLMFSAHLAYGANNDGLSLAFTALVALALAGLWIGSGDVRRSLSRFDRTLGVTAILFVAAFLVGLFSLTPGFPGLAHPLWAYVQAVPAITISRSDTTLALIRLAGVGCAFLFGLALAARESTASRLFSTFQIAIAVFAVWALIAFITDPVGLYGLKREVATSRLMAAFGSANSAALVFSVGLVMAVVDLTRALRRMEGWAGLARDPNAALARLAPGLIAAMLCAADLTLTQSRAGAVALMLALAALAGVEVLRGKRDAQSRLASLPIVGVAAALMLAALFLYRPELITRLMTADKDLDARQAIFATHWRAIQAAPWFGYGLGTFDAMNKVTATAANYIDVWNIRALHDVYLEWLEGAGIVGALPMFGAVAAAMAAVARGAFRHDRLAARRRGVLAASLVVLAMGVTDYGLEEPSIALMWALLLGAGAGAARR